jgi:signal transduction histidine kinase/CheY-like chemotaxis protein
VSTEARRVQHYLTIQARIASLVVACIVPAFVLVAVVTYFAYERERSNIRQNTLATTRELMRVVERDLSANEAALQALAYSRDIDFGDFATFHSQARNVLRHTSGFTIVLTDASGQQVVNVLQPFGSALPRHGNPQLLRRVLDTRAPVVSDLFIGAVTKKPVLAIEVPVIRDGKALYGLALGIDPEHLGELLKQQGLPPEWVVSIYDSTGTIIARTLAADQFVGRKGSPSIMRAVQQAQDGTFDAPTLEGIPVMAAFIRSPTYGWSVAIGMPETVVTADLRRWLGLYAAGAGLLLLVGLGSALVIGRRIGRSIQALVEPAVDIGKGNPISIPTLPVKEADAVGQALLRAQQLLVQRERERDQAAKAERQMLLEKQVAEQASAAKATFLANVSHELRTPLNAILGFSRLVRNAPGIPAEQIKHLDIVNRSGEHLLNLINNVLDLSRIESGRQELKEVGIDPGQLLQEVRSLMQAPAAEKGLVLVLQQAPDLPRQAGVDADKLRQVLINLVGNAIKFTARGSVVLRARVARQEPPQQARLRFEVEDSGPGMGEADRSRIFSPFVQLGGQPRTERGTGLGLVISKQYVELMGGQIGVASEPGKGSVFYFEIPVRLDRQSEEFLAGTQRGRVTALAPGQQTYRMLIAEDQPEDRLLLRKLLEPLGFELREAADGEEAIAQFEQWRPHLIWMDIGMPKTDGLQAIWQIRASPAGADTRIVAVTAHVFEYERNTIRAAGCDGLIRKPYRETDIFEALEEYLGVRFIYEAEPAAIAVAAGEEAGVARMRKLPADLLDELRHAAVLLDGQRCLEVVEKIGRIDDNLGARLNDMVNNLEYKELLALLDSFLSGTVA